MDKFTAQQIIRQQIMNKQQQLMNQGHQQQAIDSRMDDMTAQASDQFWLTLQNRGNENMERYKNGVPMDNVKDKLNNMLFDTFANINNQQQLQQNKDIQHLLQQSEANEQSLGPKIQFENTFISNSEPTARPNQLLVTPSSNTVNNQFLDQERQRQKQIEEMIRQPTDKGGQQSSIQVFNPGSSGLQVVQGAVELQTEPNDQDQYVIFNSNSNNNNGQLFSVENNGNGNSEERIFNVGSNGNSNQNIFSVGSSLVVGGGGGSAESTTASNMIPGKFFVALEYFSPKSILHLVYPFYNL